MKYPVDAMSTNYEVVTVLGRPALFTGFRVDEATVPEGYHMYEVIHADDENATPVAIRDHVGVNFWGTLILADKDDFTYWENHKYLSRSIYLEENDWNYEGWSVTLPTVMVKGLEVFDEALYGDGSPLYRIKGVRFEQEDYKECLSI